MCLLSEGASVEVYLLFHLVSFWRMVWEGMRFVFLAQESRIKFCFFGLNSCWLHSLQWFVLGTQGHGAIVICIVTLKMRLCNFHHRPKVIECTFWPLIVFSMNEQNLLEEGSIVHSTSSTHCCFKQVLHITARSLMLVPRDTGSSIFCQTLEISQDFGDSSAENSATTGLVFSILIISSKACQYYPELQEGRTHSSFTGSSF